MSVTDSTAALGARGDGTAVSDARRDLTAVDPEEVAAGLGADPKRLEPKWLYDDRGSRLFDRITELPEYYPTRTERAILSRYAGEICEAADAKTLIEIGAGFSPKTRELVRAIEPERFVGFDVCAEALESGAAGLRSEFPGLGVEAIVGDFERDLELLPSGPGRLLFLLGGTIGNLVPERRHRFLSSVAAALEPGDHFLLGADLVKDRARLVAAYDDSEGVTAEFNKNILRVLSRELDADFDPADFDHVARWDPEQEWVEISLRARRDHSVTLARAGLTVEFTEGELMRTEVSSKFRRDGLDRELRAAGMELERWWTDPDEDFAVLLAAPRPRRTT